MINEYMNQTVTWKSKGTVNDSNEPVYAADVVIKCRFEFQRKIVRNKIGEKIMSSAQMFTKSHVRPDDLITYDNIDWVVLDVADQPDLFGSVSFYEVLM
jgi:hypothetical protein